MGPRVALGLQHVLAMFASNVTPSIIIAVLPDLLLAALTWFSSRWRCFLPVWRHYSRQLVLPCWRAASVMQGTSFAFVPIMISIVKSSGIAALFGAVLVAGVFHGACAIIGRSAIGFTAGDRMVITAIGLYLLPVGINMLLVVPLIFR